MTSTDETMKAPSPDDTMEKPEVMERTFSVDFGGKSKIKRNPSQIKFQAPKFNQTPNVNLPEVGSVGSCGICCINMTPSSGNEWDVPAQINPIHLCSTGLYDFKKARFVHKISRCVDPSRLFDLLFSTSGSR